MSSPEITESKFWTRLEYLVSEELQSQRENDLRFLWCDGFVVEGQTHDEGADWLLGVAFVSEDDGRTFEHYRFRVAVDTADGGPNGINWHAMLPDTTVRWLVVDRAQKRMEIRPRGLLMR